tara:strand:+ start:55721 stop:55930 length:210 start_codon:yes stop_codon:yes gene_type:complete
MSSIENMYLVARQAGYETKMSTFGQLDSLLKQRALYARAIHEEKVSDGVTAEGMIDAINVQISKLLAIS